MKRAYAQDVLVCPRCSGPMSVIAFIEAARLAKPILLHLGMPTRAPPRGLRSRRAQSPLEGQPNSFHGVWTHPAVDD
jgi:hypothetical protein